MASSNRLRIALGILGAVCLLVSLLTVALFTFQPIKPAARVPMLLAIFIVTLVVTILCVLMLLRWLLRPYRQLVGEAKRAPVSSRAGTAPDEATFVLETFQTVVAELKDQQRRLEELTAQASARAESAQMFNERIVASVPSGLVAFDSQRRATMVNGPARSMIEVKGEPEGQPLETILSSAPELSSMVERCIRDGELFRREEVSANTPDGHTRRLGVTIAPIDPANTNGHRGALCLLTDITEVTQLREQVMLKRNLESLGEMSAGLAHEFKNSLAALQGYAQFMQNLKLDDNARTAATSLLGEVRNLSTMVTAFLNFARPQPLELSDVDLREMVDECATELDSFFEARRVSSAVEGDFGKIKADERMLRQAILNLLRNAAEAIEEESASRRVTVRGKVEHNTRNGDFSILEIHDTGPGIQPSDIQRIFIPFFTTKAKGHGVGLALAHRVVTDHGGTLAASNGVEGAVFTLRLPLT